MILTKKDNKDRVIAYLEYNVVDKIGQLCDVGQYIRVVDTWVHKSICERGTLLKFFKDNIYKYPTVKWVYWWRKKYNYRDSIYSRERLLKRR